MADLELVEPSPKSMNKFAIYDITGARPDPKNVFEAAECGDLKYVTKQIEKNIDFDPNQMDALQRTPLHWAAEMGHLQIAQALLECGADITAEECTGRTAVHLAARSTEAGMLKLLLGSVSDEAEQSRLANQTDSYGITPVFLALQKGEQGQAAFEVLMLHGGRYNEMEIHKAKTAPEV